MTWSIFPSRHILNYILLTVLFGSHHHLTSLLIYISTNFVRVTCSYNIQLIILFRYLLLGFVVDVSKLLEFLQIVLIINLIINHVLSLYLIGQVCVDLFRGLFHLYEILIIYKLAKNIDCYVWPEILYNYLFVLLQVLVVTNGKQTFYWQHFCVLGMLTCFVYWSKGIL